MVNGKPEINKSPFGVPPSGGILMASFLPPEGELQN
jgi:hypothetical protein